MRKLLIPVCAAFFGLAVTVSLWAGGAAKVILDEKFRVLSVPDEKEVGTQHWKATEKDGEIEITETMNMDYRGMKAGWKTTVKYKTKPSLAPAVAQGQTYINGKVSMQGKIEFANGKADISITGKTDKRGNPIDPPRKMERKGLEMPEGMLVFPRHLRAVGPMLIKKPGEIKNVLGADFPDDLDFPEFINWHEGYRLVREKPASDGSFFIKLFSPYSEKAEEVIKFDSKGKCISEPTSRGKFKLVRAEEPAHPAIKELVKRLEELFEKSCPGAAVALAKDRLAACYHTKEFMVKEKGENGRPTGKSRQETGPDKEGFILTLRVEEGKYKGQLRIPQVSKRKHWKTYANAYSLKGRKEHFMMHLSYGSKTDRKLISKIKRTVARYARESK